mmetsp:Transcript_33559/g.100231  ORF Transcript_33559/g.100231 Transcript_33559/m.100231 type:complete len:268 (-) Transcript_33559:636-1439(-)
MRGTGVHRTGGSLPEEPPAPCSSRSAGPCHSNVVRERTRGSKSSHGPDEKGCTCSSDPPRTTSASRRVAASARKTAAEWSERQLGAEPLVPTRAQLRVGRSRTYTCLACCRWAMCSNSGSSGGTSPPNTTARVPPAKLPAWWCHMPPPGASPAASVSCHLTSEPSGAATSSRRSRRIPPGMGAPRGRSGIPSGGGPPSAAPPRTRTRGAGRWPAGSGSHAGRATEQAAWRMRRAGVAEPAARLGWRNRRRERSTRAALPVSARRPEV